MNIESFVRRPISDNQHCEIPSSLNQFQYAIIQCDKKKKKNQPTTIPRMSRLRQQQQKCERKV